MGRVGPFETAPEIAVAVSGGGDSMALSLLAADWANDLGGRATGVTIDHGLRPESRDEARQVGIWFQARGIAHRVIRWPGPKPSAGIQAKAREARYRLLEGWCREQGVLHLLVAHHLEDQAETLAIRSARNSGPEGLAGMAAIRETPWVRIVRPLLHVPKRRLQATLTAHSQDWLEDSSNYDTRYDRAQHRAARGAAGNALAGAARAARHAGVRAGWDRNTAALLARAARPDPAGFCHVRLEPLLRAPAATVRRALARVLMCVGGNVYPPHRDSLERLYRTILAGNFRARTLGGCIVAVRGGNLVIAREAPRSGATVNLGEAAEMVWDRRFRVRWSAGPRPGSVRISALGATGLARLNDTLRHAVKDRAPPQARPALLSLDFANSSTSIPHMTNGRHGGGPDIVPPLKVLFWPTQPLAAAPFAVV